jgi:SprT protein
MTTPQTRVLAKCKEVFARAMELYGTDLSKVAISFDLRGRVGGWASAKGTPRRYAMRFNHDMLLREEKEMIDEVVPHEIAHIVCFMKPQLGRNHDYGWAHVCRQLGGTGNRTHDMPVVYGNGVTYEYTTTRGHKVRLNEKRHAVIQRGVPLTYRKGLGTVNQQCAYSIVGAGGRSFANPVVKVAAPQVTPVAITVPAPVVRPAPLVITPVSRVAPIAPVGGGSKADIARSLMVQGHREGKTYEQIIAAIMLANGHPRNLAASYYKNNAARCGVPQQ